MQMELITGENDRGRRLDRILRKALPDHGLALIHRLLRTGKVFVDGKPAKAQDRPESESKISIPSLNDVPKPSFAGETRRHQKFALEILWEGCGLLAVNKPPGIAVHGHDSLDTMVQSFLAGKITPSLSFKPGPLHRLDKPSSGVVVFSANLDGARLFSSLMRELKVRKTYLAIVEGTLKNDEIWQDKLVRDHDKKKTFISRSNTQTGSKTAVTKVTPLAVENGFSLIQAEISTGRTHQIRAQAAAHGYPLAGDVKYGGKLTKEHITVNRKKNAGFFLHAWKLEFLEYSIEAPLPEAFAQSASKHFVILL